MTGWTTNNRKLRPDGGLNLLQNCDLPPPLKVFGGADKAVLSFMNRFWTITGQEDQNQAPLQMCTSAPLREQREVGAFKGIAIIADTSKGSREESHKANKGKGSYFQCPTERVCICLRIVSWLGCLSFNCLSYIGNSNMAQAMVRVQGMCHGS